MQDSNVPVEAAITSGRLTFPRYSVAGEVIQKQAECQGNQGGKGGVAWEMQRPT
jgi:hypothetical protein